VLSLDHGGTPDERQAIAKSSRNSFSRLPLSSAGKS
jgi:hypothetical protein